MTNVTSVSPAPASLRVGKHSSDYILGITSDVDEQARDDDDVAAQHI